MRKLILMFAAVMAMTGCKKEELEETYEVVVLQNEQSIWLNSLLSLKLDSRSKVSFPLTIPSNTVALYYTVVVTESRTPVKSLNLGLQLEDLLSKEKSFGNLVSKIKVPSEKSSGEANVYLLNSLQESNFSSDHSFNYYVKGSREGHTSGVIAITDESFFTWNKYLYLGISNPQRITGENVTLEAVAIVRKSR